MNNRASRYIGAIAGPYLRCTGFFSLRSALMADRRRCAAPSRPRNQARNLTQLALERVARSAAVAHAAIFKLKHVPP
jgi:hypothetical protein